SEGGRGSRGRAQSGRRPRNAQRSRRRRRSPRPRRRRRELRDRELLQLVQLSERRVPPLRRLSLQLWLLSGIRVHARRLVVLGQRLRFVGLRQSLLLVRAVVLLLSVLRILLR